MSSLRITPRVAWVRWGSATAVIAIGMVLVVLTRSVSDPSYASWYLWLLFMLGYLSFPTVGLIIAVRRPANPLGWLLIGMGLNDTMHAYGDYPWSTGLERCSRLGSGNDRRVKVAPLFLARCCRR